MLKKSLLVVLASIVFPVLWAQQAETPSKAALAVEYKIPSEDAKRTNPVKPGPEAHARGKKVYAMECAMCHGDSGDGKGDMASDMKGITDFTNAEALKERTDGELFYIVRKGKGEMPPEGEDRAKNEDVWTLVNYIRAFAKKK